MAEIKTLTDALHECTLIKGAKRENCIHSYEYGDQAWCLYNVYDRWSRAKDNAFEYCKNLQCKFDGLGGYICSHNTCMFTYGFVCMLEGKRYLVYITKEHNYIMEY